MIESQMWCDDMNVKLQALGNNKAWSIISLSPGKYPVDYKQVNKFEFWVDGTVERYKAYLITKGYTQQEGIDFLDTFSLVAKLVAVKVMLSLTAIHGWTFTQLDVSNVFLYGDLTEKVYMTIPPGYSCRKGESLPSNAIFNLHKPIYDLKQASYQWFHKFSSILFTVGFTQSASDYPLLTKHHGIAFFAFLVYVVDIIIVSNDQVAIDDLKSTLDKEFKMKDLGSPKYL